MCPLSMLTVLSVQYSPKHVQEYSEYSLIITAQFHCIKMGFMRSNWEYFWEYYNFNLSHLRFHNIHNIPIIYSKHNYTHK